MNNRSGDEVKYKYMAATRQQLITQFNRAVKYGWVADFLDAASRITNGYFDAADLLGIASRETNLDPKWLTKAGDNGNGYGLMQIDKRSFPDFVRSGDWRNARKGIMKGAEVLMQKWKDFAANIGKEASVKSSKTGRISKYIGVKATGTTAQRIVISGYNCGRWSQYAYANDYDIDRYSTGGDYGKDVMKRAEVFRELLTKFLSAADQSAPLTDVLPTSKNKNETATAVAVPTAPPIAKDTDSTQNPPIDLPKQGEIINQYIPSVKTGVRWLGTLSIGGIASTTYAAFKELPPWQVFALGVLTATVIIGLTVLFIRYKTSVFELVKTVARINADPTQGFIELRSDKPLGLFDSSGDTDRDKRDTE